MSAADHHLLLHRAAHVIDMAALSPRNRVMDNGQTEALLTVVVRVLACLRDGLVDAGDGSGVLHLLQILVPALERVQRDGSNKQRERRKRR